MFDLSTTADGLLEVIKRAHDDHAVYECAFPGVPKHPSGILIDMDKPRFGARPQRQFLPQKDQEWRYIQKTMQEALLELASAGKISLLSVDDKTLIIIPTEKEGRTDWKRLREMSDDEAQRNAEADPDAQPLSRKELRQFADPIKSSRQSRIAGKIRELFVKLNKKEKRRFIAWADRQMVSKKE